MGLPCGHLITPNGSYQPGRGRRSAREPDGLATSSAIRHSQECTGQSSTCQLRYSRLARNASAYLVEICLSHSSYLDWRWSSIVHGLVFSQGTDESLVPDQCEVCRQNLFYLSMWLDPSGGTLGLPSPSKSPPPSLLVSFLLESR